MSVIKTEVIIKKLPRGAATDTSEIIGPTVVIEPGIARLGERLLEGESASINFFPVSKRVVTYGE